MSVLWSDKSTCQIINFFFENHGHHVLHTKEKNDRYDCCQLFVMVWGCAGANGVDNLHICEVQVQYCVKVYFFYIMS